MSWEPSRNTSQTSNRWRPPSPAPAAPTVATATLKRESWRPTSSWAPVSRPDRQIPAEQPTAEPSQPSIPRGPAQDRQAQVSSSNTPTRARERERDRERPYDDDAGYDGRGYGGKRDRKGGRQSAGGPGVGAERSWEAWNSKVEAATSKRQDDDRRPGPSRRDDYTTFDRKREMEDQAAGRSWSAWKSKVGVDDRDRRQPEPSSRNRDRDEGWRPRRRNEEESGFRPGQAGGGERRGGEERTWGAYRDKQDARQRGDERSETHVNDVPNRLRSEEEKPAPKSRSPSPRKRSPSPVRRRNPSPGRGVARRPSPDYSAGRTRPADTLSSGPSRGRERGSPDYGLGAEARERERKANGQQSRAASPSPGYRPRRSPSPLNNARARSRLRDDSPSSSSSSSSRDFSDDDRRPPPPRVAWRRDRSPAVADVPEDRFKRPRRQSPDYTPLPRPPLNAPPPLASAKAPLPPQDALFHNGRGEPPPSRNNYPPPHRQVDQRSREWNRDRPEADRVDNTAPRDRLGPSEDRHRPVRRASPDYGTGGPDRNSDRAGPPPANDAHTQRRYPDDFASITSSTSRAPHSNTTPSDVSTTGAPPRQFQPMPPTGPHADRQPNGSLSQAGFAPTQTNPHQATFEPLAPSNGAKSPVKIDFRASPNKTNVSLATRPAGLRHFFDAGSPRQQDLPTPSPQQPTPPTVPTSARESEADMDVDTPASDRHLHRPEIYLNQIAESERQYSQHLDTIAPYIRSAFKEWLDQDQTQSLPAFLIHYFGRQPDQRELHQMDQLISLRQQTSRDQAALRDLHALASKTSDAASHSEQPGSRDLQPNGRDTSASSRMPAGNDEITLTPNDGDESSNKRAHADEAYERLACVGEGTYGKVYKARRADDGVFVALKRIRMEVEKDGFPVTAMREIKLLQSLKHDNIIRLHEMMVSKGSVYMVFDYMEHDLTGLLSHPTLTFSPANLKSLNHQMLCGLGYLHRTGILHRDMKGSNILLTAQGDLKLADFGLARLYNRKRRADYTNRVITLWYRSPELLLGETAYGPEVDMWSAGCIMLEMFCGKPILQGNDEIHQLEVIHGLMGTPREEDWPEVRDLPWYELVKPKVEIRSKFREAFSKRLSPAALELAEGLLAMNPAKRLSAKKALETSYFTTEVPSMEKPTQLAGIGEHHEMSAKQERHRRKAEGR